MTDDLLSAARRQAERSSLPVRAAARMRLARVESVADAGSARITFELALEDIRSLSRHDQQIFLEQAYEIAAAIAPDLLPELPVLRQSPDDHHAETLLSIMIQHGHVDAAFDYVHRSGDPFGFPFGFAANLMIKLDPTRRVTVLRSAIEAWRASQGVEFLPTHHILWRDSNEGAARMMQLQSRFLRLFQHSWAILPSEEALAVVRESVRAALDRLDSETSASYPDGIQFTSSREHLLFEVLHVLRRLDPALAESLIVGHAQLSTAAQRYPNGTETMLEEAEREAEERRTQMAASGETCGGGFIMAGDPREFSRRRSLHQSSSAGDFGPSIDYALELYAEDSDPESLNVAPKTFWPSTTELRSALYGAGKSLGPDAVALLDRIPDADLRLFAGIELAAALAGLPPLLETSRKQRARPPMQGPQGTPMRAADGAVIRCPECQWVPVKEARWACRCGHVWNTFDTRGRCPACEYQWEVTGCHNCGEVSAHEAWYLKE